MRGLALGKQAVDDQVLARQTDGGQFLVRARGLAQRGALAACHQHQVCAGAVLQRGDGGLVLGALLVEASQRAQARGVALAGFQKAAPRARQAEQADGVAGGRGVEDDVVKAARGCVIGQQGGEFVERGDLGGAGAGELLLDPVDHRVRQHAAHRADDAIAVGLRGGGRVDLQRAQVGHGGHGDDAVADVDAKHLPDVGRRIGAHQQDLPARVGQLHSGGAGDGGLADAALAGEEQETGWVVQEVHDCPESNSVSSTCHCSLRFGRSTADHWRGICAAASTCFRPSVDLQHGPARQFRSLRVATSQSHLTINEHEW